MTIKSRIKDYLLNRKKGITIYQIGALGYLIRRGADKLIHSQKTTQVEIEEMIIHCTNAKDAVLKDIQSLLKTNSKLIIGDELDNLRDFQVVTLGDCKMFADILSSLELRLSPQIGPLVTTIVIPYQPFINIAELGILTVLALIVTTVVKCW